MFQLTKWLVRFICSIHFLFFCAGFFCLNSPDLFALDAPDPQTGSTAAVVNPATEVYISRRGLTFHQKDCSVIQGFEVKKVTLQEAVEKGMRPCAVCFKEDAALNTEVQQESEKKNRGEKLEYLK